MTLLLSLYQNALLHRKGEDAVKKAHDQIIEEGEISINGKGSGYSSISVCLF